MKNIKYNTQTACFCGEKCVFTNSELFKHYGSHAIIITSKFAKGYTNHALNDIKKVFDNHRISYIILDNVEENPSVESIVEMTASCRTFIPDFIVAIGGGSAIDSAKAIAMLLKHTGQNAYNVFYGYGKPSNCIKTEADIPIFAIPTTAGTGAEVTGFSVLTRTDTNTKLCMYPVVYCEAAFLDYRYIKESPTYLLHSGAMDALAHGIESSLHNDSNILNRSIATIGLQMFAKYKYNLLNNTLTDDDLQNMLLVSFIMGMSFMQSSTTIPHGMGYPLSHIKHVNHGLACALILGEYIHGFRDQNLVLPIVNACGFNDSAEFSDYLAELTSRDVQIQITQNDLDTWTDDFMKLDFRIASNPEPLSRDDIRNLYQRSLKNYLV